MRKVTGRKGLGKLAFFGIGNTITIETVQDGKCVRFTLNWDELINSEERYEPTFNISDCQGKTGTKIVLSELKRKTSIDKLSLAISLSKLFNFLTLVFKYSFPSMAMRIDNELRYGSLSKQFQSVDVRKNVEHIVSNVVDNSELETDTQNQIVNDLHTLIPEYPRYHWRHLHDEIKSAARKEYENKDYYRAIQEALKRYEASVKKKSGIDKSGQSLMHKAFGSDDDKLKVTKKYRKKDGSSFDSATIKDIEDSRRELSAGIFAGVRNGLFGLFEPFVFFIQTA